MKPVLSLIIVSIYLIGWLVLFCWLGYRLYQTTEGNINGASLFFASVYIGGSGGVFYCLRAVYLNYCVSNNWSDKWIPWYILRPIVSMLSGAVSFLFLKGGMIIFEAKKVPDATNIGFYILAFIAGYNVDRFMSKVEDMAKARWAIEKSRASLGKDRVEK